VTDYNYDTSSMEILTNMAPHAAYSCNENSDLSIRLWQLYRDLGVVAYEADLMDPINTVKWKLQGHWYSAAEIERLMELRAFL
jgi:hypothetical protein